MSQYRLSRWCKTKTQNGVTAVLHSLTLALVFLPSDLYGLLEKITGDTKRDDAEIRNVLGDELFKYLVTERLLVTSQEQDIAYLETLREGFSQNVTLDLMYILLTDGCNLVCTYCFEDSPEQVCNLKPTLMSVETVRKTVERFAELSAQYGNPDVKKIIQLYGGEPLLNRRGIKTVVETAKRLDERGAFWGGYQLSMITNGTLLVEEDAVFLAENDIHVGVSIDATEDLNNQYRIAKDGKTNVFERSFNAYNLLKKHGVKVGLSATMTPEMVQNFDEVLDFFVENVDSDGGIGFNLMHHSPCVPVDASYFEEAARCIQTAYERFRELDIYEERFMRKVDAFIMRKPIFVDCGVSGGQMVVAPDGRIGVCQDFVKSRKYFGDTVHNEAYDPVKAGLYDGWRNRSPFFMEACLDCEAIAICGGGCPASIELQSGSRWNVDTRVCPHSKLSLEWLIWDTFKNLNESDDFE